MLIGMLAAVSIDLNSLNQAVARCNREAAGLVFAGETSRRSAFQLETFEEQNRIVTQKEEVARRRQALRNTPGQQHADLTRQLDLDTAALQDQQGALNDQRMLEAMRRDAIDTMRRWYLDHCSPAISRGKQG